MQIDSDLYFSIDIKIHVEPKFIAENSDVDKKIFYWDFKLIATSYLSEPIKLVRKTFSIYSPNQQRDESFSQHSFNDDFLLFPGKSYPFSCLAKISEDSAIVHGELLFLKPNDKFLTIKMPIFSIDCPFLERIYH